MEKNGLETENMYDKIKNFVLQDVQNENETKKTSICMRINAIVMFFYFLFLVLLFLTDGKWTMGGICGACMAAYALSFRLTYINRTRTALWFAEILSVSWMIIFIYQLGWDCGVQLFVFPLLLLIFTPEFLSVGVKLVHGTVLCIIRLVLYMYAQNFPAVNAISFDMAVVFQMMNTFFVFLAMLTLLVLFTYDSALMQEKLVKYNKKLHKLASEDPLTGLKNRRSIMDLLTKMIAENPESIGPCVAIGDLDYFKKINDTYGHDAGDEVLKSVAALFKSYMETNGMVGRWGGEEFLFVFTDRNLDEANSLLVDLLGMVRKLEVPYGDQIIKFTMTAGVEEYDGHDIEKMINTADQKLYMGKESGRDRVIC